MTPQRFIVPVCFAGGEWAYYNAHGRTLEEAIADAEAHLALTAPGVKYTSIHRLDLIPIV